LRKRLRASTSRAICPGNSSGVYHSYDIVGDIAILRATNASLNAVRNVAAALMDAHRNLKTVLLQVSPVAGDFRLRSLVHVAGENRTQTVHKEFHCSFAVDVERCYFSPRLSHERVRIARLVKPNETIVNMFAGVGCFSVIIARHEKSAKVFSIDMNPEAVHFMRLNVRLNRVCAQVIPMLGDSKAIVEDRFQGLADRVLMPLPKKANEYLACAVSAIKADGWIHFYDIVHAEKTENPIDVAERNVVRDFAELNAGFVVPFSRVVRPTGPNWYQVALDIHVTHVPDKF
jgi:tRNA (guanine37-N1)-methyltransferase